VTAPIVVALGGNALLRQGDAGTVFDQSRRASDAARPIAQLIARGLPVVITHGNGPVVGNIFLRHEHSARTIPPMPLDVCGAESQGNIGYLLSVALDNALVQAGVSATTTTVLTRVLVASEDPAFGQPTKPIGGFLTEEEARRSPYPVARDADRGYRRVVASPQPQHIVEIAAIRALLADGVIPIAVGGGGVPVVRRPDGSLLGIEAVIDKDLASSLLARELKADALLILTDIDCVYLDFLTSRRRPVARMTTAEAQRHFSAGEFLPGSMGPKIEAAIEFLHAGGNRVVICLPEQLDAALRGEAGTTITNAVDPCEPRFT
jgi:carbamate kinase